MFQNQLIALVGSVLALVIGTAQPALAQAVPEPTPDPRADQIRSGGLRGDVSGTSSSLTGSRSARLSNTPATAEEVRIAAQALAVAAGASCEVTEAIQPGVNPERKKMYEAVCVEGPGFILIDATPPEAVDCLDLAATVATARLSDPAAEAGQQCILPANQNGLSVIGGWARDAGVRCTIDEAIAFGKNSGNNTVYEVGCAGADGYWLEKVGDSWKLQDCMQITATGGTCRFTTPQEQADGFEPKLAGTEAAACDVAQVRLMGSNANGRFYEAKCAAAGEGYIARLNNEGVTQQIYPCATAQHIGGGCTLTPAPAAAAAE